MAKSNHIVTRGTNHLGHACDDSGQIVRVARVLHEFHGEKALLKIPLVCESNHHGKTLANARGAIEVDSDELGIVDGSAGGCIRCTRGS